MTMKHTPGPWFTHRAGFSTVYVEARIRPGILQEVAACGPTEAGQEQQDANARLIAAAPELLAEIEREYIELADFANDWPGRDSMKGQMKLGRLRDLIAKATGRSEHDVQDDYGTRAARAKAKGEQQ